MVIDNAGLLLFIYDPIDRLTLIAYGGGRALYLLIIRHTRGRGQIRDLQRCEGDKRPVNSSFNPYLAPISVIDEVSTFAR
jgi:hypothetical protein